MSERSFFFDAGDGHRLHVVLWGKPGGVPVVFLHGGPGSGCNPGQRALFDPERHFVVFVDQRGAGQSLPRRSRAANTTAHLIGDLEALRRHLNLGRWLVVGGSWGATLGLAYAQAHPAAVSGLALRAVFLGTRAELEAAFLTRLCTFYPRLFTAFQSLAGSEDPLTAIWQQILHPDPQIHRPAAFLWYDMERAMSELRPGSEAPITRPDDAPLPATPFMEASYFLNDCYLSPGQILQNAPRLAGLPGILVQSRFDLLCPPEGTARLAALWPGAEIRMVEAAGHSLSDPGVSAALALAIADLSAG
ncbi:alpha/beta fold hydrolase [Falsigemmobacter faecalis]|uniref:alpha/beta fold hydrolase n=1 Tax=Falsigemmobacter faecalis TaxID=2488730 RepID=UPI0018F34572|nr:alpha/beta fold hydrolase [Falsigemmobacter faecalis]